MTVIWTSGALDGLGRVCLFWAEKDEGTVIKALDAINDGTVLLERFPEAGRPAEDLEPEHRELLIPFGGSGYVLLCRVENAAVYILAVRHQREAGY